MCLLVFIMVGGDGVEPPESEDNRFTVCPATTYGITAHIKCGFQGRLTRPTMSLDLPVLLSNFWLLCSTFDSQVGNRTLLLSPFALTGVEPAR